MDEKYTDAAGNVIAEHIADRNVEQLRFAGKALGGLGPAYNIGKGAEMQRQRPGSRPDGGMVRTGQDHATINDLNNPQDPTRQSGSTKDLLYQVMQTEAGLRAELADARKLIENLEANILQMGNEIIELKDTLARENAQRQHFEGMLRQIATLVVNGAKDKPA